MTRRNSLIIEIKAVANVMNGEVPDVKDTNFRSDFGPARYGIILLAAIADPVFEDCIIRIQNFACINIYKLWKVAKLSGLIFERARTAEKVYRELEMKHRVRFFKIGNKAYITLTKGGQKMYQDRLKEFVSLKLSTSLEKKKQEEEQNRRKSYAWAVSIMPHKIKELKPMDDNQNQNLKHSDTDDNSSI